MDESTEKKKGVYNIFFGGILRVLGLVALLIALILLVKILFGR